MSWGIVLRHKDFLQFDVAPHPAPLKVSLQCDTWNGIEEQPWDAARRILVQNPSVGNLYVFWFFYWRVELFPKVGEAPSFAISKNSE